MTKPNNPQTVGISLDGLPPVPRERFERIEKKLNSPEPARYTSKEFNGRLLAFFLEDDVEKVKEHLPELCEELKGYDPDYVRIIVKALTDKFVSPIFNADSITLTRIGIQLGSCGYETESLRCADRVDALLAD